VNNIQMGLRENLSNISKVVMGDFQIISTRHYRAMWHERPTFFLFLGKKIKNIKEE